MAGAWRIVEREAVGSTNDEARALAEAGDSGRVAVVAARQTAGRGRRGRAWASERGGLYLSALLRPALPAARVGLVPLAAGVAVAEVVEGLGPSPELRWPNDVFLRGRKLAGVLCESRLGLGGNVDWVAIGVGLNVAQPPGALAPVGGASLAEAGVSRPPQALVAPLLDAMEAWTGRAASRPESVLAAWSARAAMLGKPVRLTTQDGLLAGVAERVSSTGGLVIRMPDGVRELTDVDLVRVDG